MWHRTIPAIRDRDARYLATFRALCCAQRRDGITRSLDTDAASPVIGPNRFATERHAHSALTSSFGSGEQTCIALGFEIGRAPL